MIESIDWKIKPEQMHTIIPFCSLIILSIYDSIFLPFLSKLGICKPIHNMILGCSLTSVSFLCAAILQYKIFVNIVLYYYHLFSTEYFSICIRVKVLLYQLMKANSLYITVCIVTFILTHYWWTTILLNQ